MTIKTVQSRLKMAGFDTGDIDGEWGAKTRAAAHAALGLDAPDLDNDAEIRRLILFRLGGDAPAYVYRQSTGQFFRPDGKVLATGYAGYEDGVNNPALEAVRATGPIPRGPWSIGLQPRGNETGGPLVLPLEPQGHSAHGRSLFHIHGDNSHGERSESRGCIILSRTAREHITRAGVTRLLVI
ncbi:MAG: hypothetical protein QM645_11340 [Asticcacaulis sp.]